MGTGGGGVFRLQNDQVTRFTKQEGLGRDVVMALYEDRAGRLWMGTAGGGLCRYRDGRFAQWTTRDGLPDDLIYCVLEDAHGRLWASSSRGVFCVAKAALGPPPVASPAKLPVRVFEESDGLPSRECTGGFQPAGWRGRDGRLWFPTVRGLAVLDPERLGSVPPPRVVLEAVLVNGQEVPVVSGARWGPGARDLRFRFAAVSPAAADKARFRYRLAGRDGDWVEAGRNGEAHYTRLSPGRYVWQAQASLDQMHWSEPPLELAFVLTPFFWQTGWFALLAGGSLAGAAAWGVRAVSVRRFQRQLAVLERQRAIEQERLRIARDMHDELGGSLTQIAWLSDLARRELAPEAGPLGSLEKISATARSTLRALQEIVWAVHPDYDTLEHLTGYLCQYAEQVFCGTPVRCRFDTPAVLPDRALAADVRPNLIVSVKEALNNVLKHSDATEVRLRIEDRGGEAELVIEDNGRGLPEHPNRNEGRGLDNMRRRAAEIGGALDVGRAPAGGARVRLRWPLAAPAAAAADLSTNGVGRVSR